MLRDKGYIKHEAEDIFFLNRKLYPELSRYLSIVQSLGMDVLYPAYEYQTKTMDGSPARSAPKTGETKKVPEGERHEPIRTGELNKATLEGGVAIKQATEIGGISDAELGSPGLDRPGIWFAKQFEIRHKLEKSRFEALQIMKEGLARLMIEQALKTMEGGGELLIGKRGSRNKYSAKMLGDPDKYTISYRFMVSSQEQEIINISEAQASVGIMPMKFIVRDVLKAEDPDGWMREMDLEKAREADPALALFEMGVRYAEEAEDMEDENDADLKKVQSMMLIEQGISLIEQRRHPVPQGFDQDKAGVQESQEIKPNMQGLMTAPKLLGGQGISGQALQGAPR
jgi:hypothetical protein